MRQIWRCTHVLFFILKINCLFYTSVCKSTKDYFVCNLYWYKVDAFVLKNILLMSSFRLSTTTKKNAVHVRCVTMPIRYQTYTRAGIFLSISVGACFIFFAIAQFLCFRCWIQPTGWSVLVLIVKNGFSWWRATNQLLPLEEQERKSCHRLDDCHQQCKIKSFH